MQRSVLIEEWCTLHSFTFKWRVNLFPEEISAINRQSRDHGNDGRDVFATTKMFMHSTNLHAPPLLVLPVDRLRRIATREPRRVLPAHPFMEDRLKELNAAAKLFKNEKNKLYDYYVPAASKYYLDLIEARRQAVLVPSSTFLQSHSVGPRQILRTSNEHFPHLPTSGWELKVRFKNQKI